MLRSLRLTSHTRSTSCRCTERWWRSAMARRSACNCLRSVALSRVGSKDSLKESLMVQARIAGPHCAAADPSTALPTMSRADARTPGLVEHCLELLAPMGAVSARAACSAATACASTGMFIALIAFDRLYLKADATTRPQFEAAGCEPFVYELQGQAGDDELLDGAAAGHGVADVDAALGTPGARRRLARQGLETQRRRTQAAGHPGRQAREQDQGAAKAGARKAARGRA